ncbi:MAG: mechanosensitive ion channel family protein [Hoeflea sp.]|uniref:mechanosensitive ion channel family protein n=1 Tax=Hoeflea sp. TaxID=1940281 RepID=UPI001D56C312|nr:mechanosensitive ion channel family protein [Hoeflea sp.]MBU4531030.1 mechanosensitive ion channel family protein [Alphaproteobacteria bacterium]MBU4542805.1 mechanosensitive ion channel family protein [Alphaproteobacteria bacterium]MBU4552617.1 mechanosensitive ion channel family protein [Alphaproteobacteria bacterium]MBV1722922.1 mechanosensitive ion channel family protein [Hoeflea sp.]MBV1762833.1 mechanosensitive ion channel family protein [Hoeflea sp.]
MRFDWLTAFVLAGLLITGSVAAADAQTVDPSPLQATEQSAPVAAPRAAAPADIAASPAITAAEERLASAEANIARLTTRVAENADNDSALVDLKLELETLARGMLEIGVSLRPRLTEIKARIDELGPVPAEGEPAEPAAIVEERARLSAERARINTLTGRAEGVTVRASELGDRITDARRELFATTLFKRTEIGPAMLSEALIAIGDEVDDVVRTYGSWMKFVWAFKWHALFGWLFFALLAALVFVSGAYRLFGNLIARDPGVEDPPYTSRLSVAFWSTIIPTMAMTALVGAIYVLAGSFAILRPDVAPVISSLLAVIVAVFFVSKLARGILSPRMPAWRLVDVSNSGARVLYLLVVALVAVNGLDYVSGQLSRSLGSPVVLTVLKGIISVCLMAFILIGMALVRPMLSKSGDAADPGEAWPRVIWVTLLIGGLGLLATAALGYVGLARFAATQIVVTGAILTTMYIGYLSGKAISERGTFAQTVIGRWMETRFEVGQVGLDQAGLAAGLLISLLVLLLGVPLILLQWGFQIQDIELWFYRFLTEIRIGGITISLVGIFFGILLFIAGLLATRWFQRWLDGNVMARGQMDTGVRNSIKTGIGYLGVAVAGLIGISAAGIDLSSLALVAGALSLGIGFGLQNIVSNFVSGLILLAERPFKVGDWVVTGTTEGFVRKISVRATEIETFSRQSIIVPNSELINAPVGNWTHRNSLGRVDVPIGLSYSVDPRKVIQILAEVADSCELVLKNPPPVIYFAGFGDSSLNFEVKAHLADVLSGLSARTELRLRIFERLKAEGIEIPFPQRDLNVKFSDDAGPLAELAAKLSGKVTETVPSPDAASDPDAPEAKTSPARRPRRKRPPKTAQDSMEDDAGPDGGDR